jgi:multiple sugar transport system ATP-binding protein
VAGIRFSGVRKDYGEITALRGLDFDVAEGELVVLVGPSGSGKTTALRLAAGLEEVTAGKIEIGGKDVTSLAPAKRNVSMVFQNYALFPHLTVEENIGFGLRARQVPRTEAAALVQEAAALAGCDRLLGRKPFELSGGERQRVALARAIARHPDLFLLDEPLSNLDAQLRVQTRAELERLHQRLGATMLYVTHDQVEAMTMGDRIAVLADGVLQQAGSPDEVYRRPVNRFVARFIGSPSMNVLPAVVDGGLVRAGPFALNRPAAVDGLDDRRLELGVRPEHVEVTVAGEGIPARVEVVESVGNEAFLHLSADGHSLVARVSADLHPRTDATVLVRIVSERAYFFDADSGVTLEGGQR